MWRIVQIVVACLIVAGCNKEQAVANCKLDVARKWNEEVMKACVEPWSPLANTNPSQFPKCSDVDQARSYMRLCMKAAGYEFTAQCSDDRFKSFGRKCYAARGLNQLFDALMESDLLSDTTEAPWGGYARNKGNSRLEWVNFYATRSECINKLTHIISADDWFNSQFYSAPIGCAYNGNSYWRVRFMNALWGGKELGCIATSGEPKEATDIGMLYGPVLGRESPRPAGAKWHCV